MKTTMARKYGDNWASIIKPERTELDKKVLKQRQREKELFPLKITSKIMIFVPKEKCNQEYAQEWLKRYKQQYYVDKVEQ